MKSYKTKASFLLIPMLVLILFGIIMIGSADGWVYDPRSFDIDPLMIRQFVGLLIGLVLIFLIQQIGNGNRYFRAALGNREGGPDTAFRNAV